MSEKKLMQVISKKTEIDKLQKKLAGILEKGRQSESIQLGYQAGRVEAPAYFLKKYNIWWAYLELKTRHWNAFGISDYADKFGSSGVHITCEINFPILKDGGQKPEGLFVTTGKKIYLAHTGKLNGKRHDGTYCKKDAFMQYADNMLNWEDVYWYNGQMKKVAIISNLDDKDLISNISQFVEIVYRFKKGRSSQDERESRDELAQIKKLTKMPKHDKSDLLENGSITSSTRTYTKQVFVRDNMRIEAIKENRGYKCQICHIGIKRKNMPPYVEGAHIKPKAEGGNESPDNIMILCPNHHIEFDKGVSKILIHDKNKVKIKLDGKMYTLDLNIQK